MLKVPWTLTQIKNYNNKPDKNKNYMASGIVLMDIKEKTQISLPI